MNTVSSMGFVLHPFLADLHIHTCLSPCAEREMTPELIFSRALALRLDVIAITDHNSTSNLPAFLKSPPTELWVIPGMEVQTKEEAHMVCLFPDLNTALTWGEMVKTRLPLTRNNPDFFGEQVIIDSAGNKTGEETRLLLNSVSFSVSDVVEEVHKLGGITYPAHIDRPSYSVLSQLGFLPPKLKTKALEISRRGKIEEYHEKYSGFSIIRSSDAHRLSDLDETIRTVFQLKERSWPEIIKAFDQIDQRNVTVY